MVTIMKRYFLISFSLHLNLLLIVLINFIFSQNTQHSFASKINSYISNYSSYQKTVGHVKKPITKHGTFKFKKTSNTVTINKTTKSINNQQVSQLILYLHDLIQSQIKYPSDININVFRGNKKVYLSLTLFPDGHIEKTKIIQSSGILIFDNTVLDTISSLPIITIAQKMLQEPKEFIIPIEFFAYNTEN